MALNAPLVRGFHSKSLEYANEQGKWTSKHISIILINGQDTKILY